MVITMNKAANVKKSSIVFQTSLFVILVIVLGAAGSVIRTFQILYFIDFETGFFIGPMYLSYLLHGVLIFAFLVLTCMSLADRNSYNHLMSEIKIRIISIFALLMGMALAFYATTDFLTRLTANLIVTPGMIRIAIQFLSAMSLIYISLSKPSPNIGLRDLVHLIPCCWAGIVLVSMFMQHTIVINISENLYNILRMIFALLFFFFCAMRYAGFNGKRTTQGLIICGYMVFVLGCVCTFPLLIAHFNGQVYLGSQIVQSSILDVALSIYAFIYTTVILACRKKVKSMTALNNTI